MGPPQGMCEVRWSPLPAAASWQGRRAEVLGAGAGQVHHVLVEGSRSVGLGSDCSSVSSTWPSPRPAKEWVREAFRGTPGLL